MGIDRRESMRLPCSLNLRCRRPRSGPPFRCQVLDLSHTGARLEMDSHQPDRDLLLEFHNSLSLPATAVWVRPLATGGQMLGVRFEKLAFEQKSALMVYLSALVRSEVARLLSPESQ